MTNFRNKLLNWLANKIPSRTVEMSGGADKSLIQRNQISSVVSALKAPSSTAQPAPPLTTRMPERTSTQPTPSIIQSPVQSAPPLATTMQGTAFTQGSPLIAAWQPKIGNLLPEKQIDKEKFIDGIIEVENTPRDPNAINRSGKVPSYGMMQINKQTWEEIDDWRKLKGQKVYPFKTSWMNPDKNIEYGTQYLFEVIPEKELIPYNKSISLENIIGSYNAGPKAFRKGDHDVKKFPQVLDYIKKFQKFYE